MSHVLILDINLSLNMDTHAWRQTHSSICCKSFPTHITLTQMSTCMCPRHVFNISRDMNISSQSLQAMVKSLCLLKFIFIDESLCHLKQMWHLVIPFLPRSGRTFSCCASVQTKMFFIDFYQHFHMLYQF